MRSFGDAILFTNGGEIVFDDAKTRCRVAFAELARKPFSRISVKFARVTSLAGGQDITRRIAASFRYWNEMILRQIHSSEQPLLISAIRASMVPVGETSAPIFVSEGMGQIALSGSSPFPSDLLLHGIILSPCPFVPLDFFWMNYPPSSDAPHHFLRILSVVSFVSFIQNIFSCDVVNSVFFENILMILVKIRQSALPMARQAQPLNPIWLTTMLFKFISGLPFVARTTYATNWKRIVDHLKYSFAGFAFSGVDEAAKLAVRSVNYAELVHAAQYTTFAGVFLHA